MKEMNRFVFLTNCISAVGGSQLYIARKTEWLKSIGWEVDVFYYEEGDIQIGTLKQYKPNLVPQLTLPLCVVNKTDKKNIINKIYKTGFDKTIIESHLQPICLWGEYIASEVGAMNVCYLLSEGFLPLTDKEKKFYAYKRKKNLLFGIKPSSIQRLLDLSEPDEESHLPAVGSSVGNVEDFEYELVRKIKKQKTIISIGRLEKPYVPSMINSVLTFACRHENDKFNVILVGDSEVPGIRESVIDKLNKASNLSVYCTGFINPIPRSLLKLADVAISSAGSVRVTEREGILTISVDSSDYKAIGICGITTTNSMFRNSEPQIEIEELLEDVLYNNKYNVADIKIDPVQLDYSRHMKIMERFDVGSTYEMNWPLTIKQRLQRLLYSLIGCNAYTKIQNYYRKEV